MDGRTATTSMRPMAKSVRRSITVCSRDRVVSAGGEGVAPCNPPRSQPAALQGTVAAYSLQCVGRTRGLVTTWRGEGRCQHLVRSDDPTHHESGHEDQSRLDFSHALKSPERSLALARYAAARARTTRSTEERRVRRWRRTCSRSLRRKRFRATAVALCRGTTRPRRGWPTSFEHHAISNRGVRERRPDLSTAWRSDPRERRQHRGSPSAVSFLRAWTGLQPRDAFGPSCAAGSGLDVPTACAFAPGSHVC
jgi:hypothetical protein